MPIFKLLASNHAQAYFQDFTVEFTVTIRAQMQVPNFVEEASLAAVIVGEGYLQKIDFIVDSSACSYSMDSVPVHMSFESYLY